MIFSEETLFEVGLVAVGAPLGLRKFSKILKSFPKEIAKINYFCISSNEINKAWGSFSRFGRKKQYFLENVLIS